jgi:hypothetical protein
MFGQLVFIAVVYVPMILLAILFLRGKGAALLSGYNTINPEKKAKYNMEAICRFMGYNMILFILFFALAHVGILADITWLWTSAMILGLSVIFGGRIYAHHSERFCKSDIDASESFASNEETSRASIIAPIIISVAVAAAVGVMFFLGEAEPTVTVLDDSIQISGMYGTNVSFSEISDILLLENSMEDIGVGMRTNGYGGFGATLKGNFQSSAHGETLLFVRTTSSPTIQIARNDKRDIFLCFGNSEETRQLYDEIMAAFATR